MAATAIAVGDTDLPREVVDAFQGAGGDLVRPSEWTGRFGSVSSFPEMVGSSTRVVEALQRIEPAESGDGWVRTDEMSWLVIDDRGRDELLDAVASGVGSAGGWDPAASTDEGAECLNGPLDTAFVGVWTLQGCDYRRFADLLAIGLTRTGVSSDGPALIDPSVVAVSSTLGGRVVFSEVRLGQPGADGATLHLSAQVRFDEPVDLTTAVDELVVGVLPGWQVLRGDGSVLLSGPTGATWTITPTVAVFEWAGRW